MVFRAGEFNRCHSRRRGHRLRGHAPPPARNSPGTDSTRRLNRRPIGVSYGFGLDRADGRIASPCVSCLEGLVPPSTRRPHTLPAARSHCAISSCSVDRLTAGHVTGCIREPRIRRCRPTGSRCERALAVASTEAFHRTDSLPSGGWASRPTTPIASRHKTVGPDTCPEAIPAGAVLADGSLRTRSGAGSSTTGPGPQCPQCRRGTPMTPVPWPVERRGAMLRLENPNNSA